MAVDIDDWDWISEMAKDAEMSPLRLFCALYPTHGNPPKPYKAASSKLKIQGNTSATTNRISEKRKALKKDVAAEEFDSSSWTAELSKTLADSLAQEEGPSESADDKVKEGTVETSKPQTGGKPLVSTWSRWEDVEYPNVRILIGEGPLHLRSLILIVMEEMIDRHDYPNLLVILLSQKLMSEEKTLSEELALPWTTADDDWEKSEQHSKWRDFTDDKILLEWKMGKTKYPAHNSLVSACDALGVSLSAWRFAWNIVAVDDPGSHCFREECFDEVFDAYEKVFVNDRAAIREIREYLLEYFAKTWED